MKKILILTLGVGNLFGKDAEISHMSLQEKEMQIRKMIEQNQYPYEKTDYVVEISGTESERVVQSEYVAEIQIKEYQPDIIILIGTVKSGWSMFYRKFTQDRGIDKETLLADVMKLYHMEETYGKDTDTDKLKELEKEIQQIYNDKLVLSREKKIDIKVCLIRYGINNAELMENYRNISDIEKYLNKNEEYDVAFDITHSFRSLPIYNLVILNYLQQVSSYKMKISHIFYGNFDIKRENGNKAPLVDLADMGEVLNLTNAVSEFKNTGNAASLIRMLPSSEERLCRALEKFDWATQMNGRNEVIEALKELSDVLNEKTETRNRYVDAKNMLKSMLSEEPDNILKIVDCNSKGEAQLLLVKWYQKQNRYGLAVTTSTEALRSMLVPCYLRKFHSGETDYEDENRRKEAVQRLGNIVILQDRWIQSEITDFLVELENLRHNEVIQIRNIFAHNLLDRNQKDFSHAKQVIDTFIDMLTQLHRYICDNEEEFERVYCYVPETAKVSKKTGDGIRIFISESYDTLSESAYMKLRKSPNRKYTVYKLPEQIIGKSKNMDSNTVSIRASLLCEYLKRHFDIEHVHIIFDGRMSEKKWWNYSMILYQNNCQHVYLMDKSMIRPVTKPAFEISYQSMEKYNESVMEQEPKLYTLNDLME